MIPSLTECPKNWCSYSYQGPPSTGYLYRSLGCTRFSAGFQKFSPHVFKFTGPTHWNRIDGNHFFFQFQPHVHGQVAHHHDYLKDPVLSRLPREFAREVQPDGSVVIYRNTEDGTRTDEAVAEFASFTEWADAEIAAAES